MPLSARPCPDDLHDTQQDQVIRNQGQPEPQGQCRDLEAQCRVESLEPDAEEGDQREVDQLTPRHLSLNRNQRQPGEGEGDADMQARMPE